MHVVDSNRGSLKFQPSSRPNPEKERSWWEWEGDVRKRDIYRQCKTVSPSPLFKSVVCGFGQENGLHFRLEDILGLPTNLTRAPHNL